MPALPRLFVASSTRAQSLANALAKALELDGSVAAISWAEEQKRGISLLDHLINHATTADFAVIILTKDDAVECDDGRDRFLAPRDNCIFELGLFVGAFGGLERCFLLSSIDAERLFNHVSDIAGQLHLPLEEPDFGNETEVEEKARKHAKKILTEIRQMNQWEPKERIRGYTIQDVLEMEKDKARVPDDSVVMIKEQQPPETELSVAGVVFENMRDREVNYVYLFGLENPNPRKCVELLRSLLASAVITKRKERQKFQAGSRQFRLETLRKKQKQIRKVIPLLRNNLFIELIADVKFDEFCIHNADHKEPTGYIKIHDRYVPLPKEKAKLRYRYKAYRADKTWPTAVIFDLEPAKGETEELLSARTRARKGIEKQIRVKFPEELHGPLLRACFGSE